nr:hypothetical protein CFP56_08044 [Quercus suber]
MQQYSVSLLEATTASRRSEMMIDRDATQMTGRCSVRARPAGSFKGSGHVRHGTAGSPVSAPTGKKRAIPVCPRPRVLPVRCTTTARPYHVCHFGQPTACSTGAARMIGGPWGRVHSSVQLQLSVPRLIRRGPDLVYSSTYRLSSRYRKC